MISLSTGLLKKMTADELEALLVHEVCHISRSNTFGYGVSTLLSEALLGLAEFLDFWWPPRHWKWSPLMRNQRPFRTVLAPLAWFLIRINVRPQNYFINDDLSVQFLPDRKILAQALWKLDSLNQARPLDIPDCSSHLFVVNPRGLRETHWFYNTHPPMSLRLKRLIGSEYF